MRFWSDSVSSGVHNEGSADGNRSPRTTAKENVFFWCRVESFERMTGKEPLGLPTMIMLCDDIGKADVELKPLSGQSKAMETNKQTELNRRYIPWKGVDT